MTKIHIMRSVENMWQLLWPASPAWPISVCYGLVPCREDRTTVLAIV